ncbi:glycerophosphodiester phosphodiesterase [Nocardiopsis kunsanensis]|uniref:Glycerophosphoryl diester phosphodiesterase n=1 Tax=Nocardiopsis kunsanensis TaxID=141693 RepID=A0A918X646_9ACTN|nr:glycerophosphodiester phosphodiesterase [Nocardiopsis kunsanensis]GHD14897.1 glycerophosphoryl diester phosphodiesterase [Nocardiopsis kunsanensis]
MTLSIALRGDTARHPGNTLPALRSALRAGADLVKVDVHLTRDDYPVLVDDRLVAAPDTAPRPVDEMSLAELAATRRDVESRAPTLMEALAEFRAQEVPHLLVEATSPRAALAADTLLRERGFADQLVFTGPYEALDALRGRSGRARLLMPWEQSGLPPDDVVRALRPDFLGIHHSLLTRDLINQMHGTGLGVAAWAADDFTEMARLVGMGVDAVATDQVGELVPIARGNREEPQTEPA